MATVKSSLVLDDKMSRSINNITNAFERSRVATKKAQTTLDHITAKFGQSSKQAERATAKYNAFAAAQKRMQANMIANASARSGFSALSQAEKAIKAQSQAMQEATSKSQLFAKAGNLLKAVFGGLAGKFVLVQEIINGLKRAWTAFVENTKQSIATFSKFESTLTDVTNLLNKEDKAKYGKNLKQASIDAIKLGISVEDANTALFNAQSALGDVDKALAVYKQSQILAKGGATSLSIATDGLTNVLNAYRLSAEDAEEVATSFFRAQVVGKTTVGELAQSIGSVAPIAKSAGVGYKELLSTMAILTKGGLDTASASTALRASLTALIKPSKQASEVLRQYGVPVGAAELQSKGLTYALVQLQKAAEANPDVMAEMIPNIRALTGVSTLTAESIAEVNNTIKEMNNDLLNGTGLLEAYSEKMNTLEASENRLKGAKTELARVWGEFLSPTAQNWNMICTKVIEIVTATIAKITELDQKFRGWQRNLFGGNKSGSNLAFDYDKTMDKWNRLKEQAKSLGLDTSGSISKLESRINAKLVQPQKGINNNPLTKALDGNAIKTKQQGAIEIKEEDLRMLNDIAMQDVALKNQVLSPNINFGDVQINENADADRFLNMITETLNEVTETANNNLNSGVGK